MASKQSQEHVVVTIDSLDDAGNGIAFDDKGHKVIVPYVLPEEMVDVVLLEGNRRRSVGRVADVIVPSVHRGQAPCPYFGECGGCKLQHLDADYYKQYREKSLRKAYSQAGFDAGDIYYTSMGARSRRKVRLKVKAGKKLIQLGFYREGEHKIVSIDACLVADASIDRLIPLLPAVIAKLKRPMRLKEIELFAADNGVVLTFFSEASFEESERALLEAFAHEHDIIQCLWCHDDDYREVMVRSVPTQRIGEYNIAYIAGGFSQATLGGQQAITEVIVQHMQECSAVLDMFAGYGAYSLPLIAQGKTVTAYEGSIDMVLAMQHVVEIYDLAERLGAKQRDLFALPLPADNISSRDGVVINPPRNGAGPQMREVAKSGVKKVIVVSCSNESLAKDLVHFYRAGYVLVASYIIDQFTWSRHSETVSVFQLG